MKTFFFSALLEFACFTARCALCAPAAIMIQAIILRHVTPYSWVKEESRLGGTSSRCILRRTPSLTLNICYFVALISHAVYCIENNTPDDFLCCHRKFVSFLKDDIPMELFEIFQWSSYETEVRTRSRRSRKSNQLRKSLGFKIVTTVDGNCHSVRSSWHLNSAGEKYLEGKREPSHFVLSYVWGRRIHAVA